LGTSYVSGAYWAVSEPLLMTEQISIAADAATAVVIPMVVDAGAGNSLTSESSDWSGLHGKTLGRRVRYGR